MIKTFSFRPEYFNNNGDQGNLEALAHYTGSEVEPDSIDRADFVLFGDGSRAAMREFEGELRTHVESLQLRFDLGQPTLLVGSCYEFFAPMIKGLPALTYGQRVSEFREVNQQGIQVKGYRNSEIQGSDLVIKGAFVATTFYGPVLAKNLKLAELVLSQLGLQLEVSERERDWIAKL